MIYRMLTTLMTAAILFSVVPSPAQENENLLGLQKHFEQVIRVRFDTMFVSVGSSEQWESRKVALRRSLERMFWHGREREQMPPAARITHRTETESYRLECLVLETAPGFSPPLTCICPKRVGGLTLLFSTSADMRTRDFTSITGRGSPRGESPC